MTVFRFCNKDQKLFYDTEQWLEVGAVLRTIPEATIPYSLNVELGGININPQSEGMWT
jgi:hypothetical protein